MSLRNVKLITFDLFNTLYTPKDPIALTYARPLRKHNIDVSIEAIDAGFRKAFKAIQAQYPIYGYAQQMTSDDWWQKVITATWLNAGVPESKVSSTELVAERTQLISHFSKGGYEMYPEVPRVLKHLRRRGIRAGVVSNMDRSAEEVLGALGIREYFDFVVRSEAVGFEKPDSRIFEVALRAANVGAFDAVHVGDHLELDYEAAKRAGMGALLLDREGREEYARARREHPGECITSLEDILHML